MDNRTQNGIILKCIGGFYYVKTADGVLECRAIGLFRKLGITPLAGDRVEVRGDEGGYVVCAVKPRANSFDRPPIANVGRLFLIVSTVDPKPNLLVLDTLTAIACHSGVTPDIVLTKTDLAADDGVGELYRAAGFTVLDVRRDVAAGLARIRERAAGQLCVFVGNSGTGKSTLLNELCPGLTLQTGETSAKLGRGKHTTRAVELFEFEGGYLADTPGFSALDFERGFSISKEELAGGFPDIERWTDGCYFTGCSHTVEKGCRVLEALEAGYIAPSRHKSYRALYEQAQKRKEWEHNS